MTVKQASCTLSTPCPRLRVVAVVLAAGTASRMGGRPKSLLQREGQTLLARLLTQLAQAGIDHTVLVLGHHAQLMQQALQAGWQCARECQAQGWIAAAFLVCQGQSMALTLGGAVDGEQVSCANDALALA